MKVTEIKFRKNVNIGSYLHEHAEVTVVIEDDDETIEEAAKFARECAQIILDMRTKRCR